MDILILYIIIFAIGVPLLLLTIIPIYKDYKKTTIDVINHDTLMKKFVYKVPYLRKDIIKLLDTKNSFDKLSCTFDTDKNIIKFSDFVSGRNYYIKIHEYTDYSIVLLEQVALVGDDRYIPLKLNSFMIAKLQAEIVPFSQYYI